MKYKQRADNNIEPEQKIKIQNRPKNRGDCVKGLRPCPFISCKWHLIWELPGKERCDIFSLSDNAVVDYILSMGETCVLDVADTREATLEEIGSLFHVTRERVRQIEAKALRKLRHPIRSRKLRNFLDLSYSEEREIF